MSYDVAHFVLGVIAIYVAVGVVIAVPFVTVGVGRIDPAAHGVRWTFRALVFPGVVALWPFILRRWLFARRAS